MKLEIPFIEQIFKEQLTLNFKITWRENLERNKKRLFWAIPFIIIGSIMLYGNDNLGFISVAIGIHYVFNFFNYYLSYKKSKKKYFDLVASEIDNEKRANQNAIWNFNEDHFGMKNYKYEVKIKWGAFKSYRIISDNLFLDLDVGTNLSYILGEKEIGLEKYNEVVEFVKHKISLKINS
ncbi:hypothetical protein [Aquimarina mytili]|uniref:YcxB-like protein domain-containing protein n=1 Tax=Aquimarina mytili TaxID=874423 RepID=A0A937A6V7_9FLAO|nr:hypothetical protein [Aquimarina mytili]MBL0685354.1 hypothetical protein [Aquimarina mytili]